MKAKQRGNQKWPGVVFLLTRAPRTAMELIELTGADPGSVRLSLKLLEGEGLVRQRGMREGTRRPSVEWEWLPAPRWTLPA
jgi:DNA-binding transcriptional regulator GbsR (MarR family)